MKQKIEVTFIGGPRAGKGVVEVRRGARLPDSIPQQQFRRGTYRFTGSASTWDGAFSYQDPQYKFEPEE